MGNINNQTEKQMKSDIAKICLAFISFVSAQLEQSCFGNGGYVGQESDDINMANLEQLVDNFDLDMQLYSVVGCANYPMNMLANLKFTLASWEDGNVMSKLDLEETGASSTP